MNIRGGREENFDVMYEISQEVNVVITKIAEPTAGDVVPR